MKRHNTRYNTGHGSEEDEYNKEFDLHICERDESEHIEEL
jgi:hypothetical protein